MSDELTGLQEFEDLIEGIDHLFWVIEYSNSDKSLYSSNFRKITGYTYEEISALEQKYSSIIHSDDRDNYLKLLQEFESNSLINNTELSYRIVGKDGSIIWLKELLKIDRKSDGRIDRLVRLSVCIDDLQNQNFELQNSVHKLEELNNAKDRFISIVSHDLRSPFATLLGFTDILLQERDLPETEMIEYLTYIHEAAKTQLSLINQLIDWSRLQTGRIKPEFARINLKMLIQNIGNNWLEEATRKRVDIRIEIPGEISITADERLISQALSNFMSNAVRFSEEGKVITILPASLRRGL